MQAELKESIMIGKKLFFICVVQPIYEETTQKTTTNTQKMSSIRLSAKSHKNLPIYKSPGKNAFVRSEIGVVSLS